MSTDLAPTDLGLDCFTSTDGSSLLVMDPRVERTKQAVRRATLEVLGQRGYAAFTVEAVAEVAGVAKSTIYRHWPTKIGLIADSLETLNQHPQPEVTAIGVRDRIQQNVEHLAEVFSDSVLSACVPALIEAAEHHSEVREFLHTYNAQRRQRLVDTIQSGIDSGELPGYLDAELLALALIGPIIYRRTMTPKPMTSDEAFRIVEMILRRAPQS